MNDDTNWARLQTWLQEATLCLEYCTRLAMGKRTGNVEGAMGDNSIFLMQLDADDGEVSEAHIRDYVTNIGKLAAAGWKTNHDFPVFAPIEGEK